MGKQRWMAAGFVSGCVFMAALLVRCGGAAPIAKMLDGGLAMLMPDSGTSAIQDAGASPTQDAGTSSAGLTITTMSATCSQPSPGYWVAEFSVAGLDALHPPVMQAWLCRDAAGGCNTAVITTNGTTVSVTCGASQDYHAILHIIQ